MHPEEAHDLRQRLQAFADFRATRLVGSEKSEAHVFLDRLFRAFGHEGVPEAGAILEQGVRRRSGTTAFADLVWKPRLLIEMKKAGEDLSRHYQQAFDYWVDLVPGRPQYVILCNFDEFWIFDLNKQVHDPVDVVSVADLPQRWEAMSFLLPDELPPVFQQDRVAVTKDAASTMANLYRSMEDRGVDPQQSQRFVLQCVLAMFGEDIGLFPSHLFTSALDQCLAGSSTYLTLFPLFEAMNTPGVTPDGPYQGTPYFNGGLLKAISPVELSPSELAMLRASADQDWGAIRPAIFGTIFEQVVVQTDRHRYGQHFTDEADIMKVVTPTITRPWLERIADAQLIRELNEIETDLLNFRVLDPACGCGNFLYLAYRDLRRVEAALRDRRREVTTSARGQAQPAVEFVSPTHFFGVDIDPFAVEVAKLTLMLGKKLSADDVGGQREVLPLDDLSANFHIADALDPTFVWPTFHACIGNPPYLGRRKLQEERGAAYVHDLDSWFPDVGGVSDYVVYWFREAHDLLPPGGRAGLVATDSVREGSSKVASLDYIVANGGTITEAVSSQPWSGEAQVRVSIVNWVKGEAPGKKTLILADGSRETVDSIGPNLSMRLDVTVGGTLQANRSPKVCHQGQTAGHEAFVLTADEAFSLTDSLEASQVVRPFLLGTDLVEQAHPVRWIIDFAQTEKALAEFAAPKAFARIRRTVLPARQAAADREALQNQAVLDVNSNARVNRHDANFLRRWWQLGYRRRDLISQLGEIDRYIAMPRYATAGRPSVFAYVSSEIRPSDQLIVFTFDDDYSMGILMSSLHRTWFEGLSSLGSAIRYTTKATFDKFPWPQAPSPASVDRIVEAVAEIMAYRRELADEGLSLGAMYDALRTPGQAKLGDLHGALDRAVLEAYGFDGRGDPARQLLDLNLDLAAQEAAGGTVRGPGPSDFRDVRVTKSMMLPVDPAPSPIEDDPSLA